MIPDLQKLDDLTANNLMRSTIEDVINKWKHELDLQVKRMDFLAQRTYDFEMKFQTHFETVK